MKRSINQLSLFDAPAVKRVAVPPRPLTEREQLVDQIVRDTQTLQLEDWLISPDEDFYIDRIVAYRQTLEAYDREHAQ